MSVSPTMFIDPGWTSLRKINDLGDLDDGFLEKHIITRIIV
jgi:hypothetical protein